MIASYAALAIFILNGAIEITLGMKMTLKNDVTQQK